MRSIVVAAVALTVVATAGAAGQSGPWEGTWASPEWGTMVLTQSGTSVSGTYTHDAGRITGSVSGNVLTGTWTEAPTRAGPKDAGPFRFTMSSDLRSWSGTWQYADGSGGGNWTGTRVGPPPASTTTPTTPSSKRDTSPPTVRAYPSKGLVKPGSRASLSFSAKDDSGRATVHADLYEGGTKIRTASASGAAKGQRGRWRPSLAAHLKGPLYFCVWAQDAAGNRSARAPRSSCAWISLLVPIARVSNGCGGAGWAALVAIQNYFGNTHTYSDSNINPLAKSYTVNFKAACDLHDAGYGGHTVADAINGGTIDYHGWSRARVDTKFLADMRRLCGRAIPAAAKTALTNCRARGGNASFGAATLYNFVHKHGWRFFDADLTKPGIQRTGHRNNS
jgi:hypothetical protein